MLTADRLRELLQYDPETGVFTWRVDRTPKVKAGDVAGALTGAGRVQICIDGKFYIASRLAALYMTGEWPEGEVDHRDCDPSNNRWSNLRAATHAENCRNRRKRRDNSTGYKGVQRKGNKYRARIIKGGKSIYLGYFDTPVEAHAIYTLAAKDLHGEFARAL